MVRIEYRPVGRTGAWALLALLCLAASAYGAERITLANGFDLVCNHHQVVNGSVRVFPKAEEADYFELEPAAVTGYETVPDPPVARTPDRSIGQASGSLDIQKTDTRLTGADLDQ